MKIHISKHSGKMLGFESISTNSLTNDFCKQMRGNSNWICSKCYANNLLSYRRSLEAKLEQNSKILSESVISWSDLPNINALYFRFNSFGELINRTHLTNLINICIKNPKTTFSLWTKRTDLVYNRSIPDNMILIYSNPIIDKPLCINRVPPIFDKIFSVYSNQYIEKNNIEINCQKSCYECLKCYTKNNIKIINERLK